MTTRCCSTASSAVLPQRCAVCGLIGEPVCAACLAAFVRIAPPLCERCGSPGHWPVRRCAECAGRRLAFGAARSALVYDERARALVRTGRSMVFATSYTLQPALITSGTASGRSVLTFVPADDDRRLRAGPRAAVCACRGFGRALGRLRSRTSLGTQRDCRPSEASRSSSGGVCARRVRRAGSRAGTRLPDRRRLRRVRLPMRARRRSGGVVPGWSRSCRSRGQFVRLKEVPRRRRADATSGHGAPRSGPRLGPAVRGAKFRKLERRLHEATLIEVVLDRERNRRSQTIT